MKISTKKSNNKLKFVFKESQIKLLKGLKSYKDNKKNSFFVLDKKEFLDVIRVNNVALSNKVGNLLNFKDFVLK
jgi:hypothetical protein